jgi:exodeoxyribonuclease VII small subunit
MTFEQKLARLEEIAAALDRENVELELALKLFEEGVELLRTAGAELKDAGGKVKVLVEKLDGTFDVADFSS